MTLKYREIEGATMKIRLTKTKLLVSIFGLSFGLIVTANANLPLNNKNKSQQNYNKIVDTIYLEYKDIYAKKGLKFKINSDWNSTTENASAKRLKFGDTVASLDVFGALYRNNYITNDSFLLVLCHELGHHLAGEPIKAGSLSASAEGQADYFATHLCMPKILSKEDNQFWSRNNSVDFKVKLKCDQTWGLNRTRSLICQRTIAAADDLVQFFNGKLADGQVGSTVFNPDRSKVKSTNTHGYPPNQCRLDTYVAGALCKTENISGMNKNRNCSFTNAFENKAIRPACWFGYPQHAAQISTEQSVHLPPILVSTGSVSR